MVESGLWRNQNKVLKSKPNGIKLTVSNSLYTSFQLPRFLYVYYDRVRRNVALVNYELTFTYSFDLSVVHTPAKNYS